MTSKTALSLLAAALAGAAPLAACQKPAAPSAPARPAASAPGPQAAAPGDTAPDNTAPAGEYRLDPAHASVNFRVSHMGLSNWTARFTRIDATLAFDPAHPAAQSVTATIDARSVQSNYPEPQKVDFDSQIERQFLGADRFPTITFRSTKVEPTGPATARVTGDLTLRGVTKPVVLDARFNGGMAANGMDPAGHRVGFSATTRFRRSDFGIGFGIPAPGSRLGVGDEVEVIIEAEFTRLADKPAA